jgi:hypothetical protein
VSTLFRVSKPSGREDTRPLPWIFERTRSIGRAVVEIDRFRFPRLRPAIVCVWSTLLSNDSTQSFLFRNNRSRLLKVEASRFGQLQIVRVIKAFGQCLFLVRVTTKEPASLTWLDVVSARLPPLARKRPTHRNVQWRPSLRSASFLPLPPPLSLAFSVLLCFLLASSSFLSSTPLCFFPLFLAVDAPGRQGLVASDSLSVRWTDAGALS